MNARRTLVFGVLFPVLIGAARALAVTTALAPADEYFGGPKLSYLGIQNVIRDQTSRYRYDPRVAESAIARMEMVESAIRAWERRYPRDPGIPRAIYRLDRFYAAITTSDGLFHELAARNWLFADYGKSAQAKALRKDLNAQDLMERHRATPAPSTLTTP